MCGRCYGCGAECEVSPFAGVQAWCSPACREKYGVDPSAFAPRKIIYDDTNTNGLTPEFLRIMGVAPAVSEYEYVNKVIWPDAPSFKPVELHAQPLVFEGVAPGWLTAADRGEPQAPVNHVSFDADSAACGAKGRITYVGHDGEFEPGDQITCPTCQTLLNARLAGAEPSARRPSVDLVNHAAFEIGMPACGATGGRASYVGPNGELDTTRPITCPTCLVLLEKARHQWLAEKRQAMETTPPPSDASRRVKVVAVDRGLLGDLLRREFGLPDDAVVCAVSDDVLYNRVLFRVQSGEYPVVHPGNCLEIVEPRVKTTGG